MPYQYQNYCYAYVRVCYNMVWGRPLQLLDSRIGPVIKPCNYGIIILSLQYEITLQYYGACEPVGPTEAGPTEAGPTEAGPSPQSFVGWILIGM